MQKFMRPRSMGPGISRLLFIVVIISVIVGCVTFFTGYYLGTGVSQPPITTTRTMTQTQTIIQTMTITTTPPAPLLPKVSLIVLTKFD
jgi:Ni,Fe-hydrogenase I cytochrome b subunit